MRTRCWRTSKAASSGKLRRMKRLTLLRHAKSDWNTGQRDHDRPLNRRGERDAPEMGRRFLECIGTPELILSSTANRALTTARLFAGSCDYEAASIDVDGELYHASPGTLLHAVNQLDDAFADVVLVSHNPGITEFATLMSDQRLDNLPAAGLWSMLFDDDSWGKVVPGEGRLDWHDYPKNENGL